MKIQYFHPFPKYFLIQTLLRERISKHLRPGDRLPPETVLSKEFGVTRVTLRQALETLERDGLIERERGRGTFVTAKAAELYPDKLTGLIEELVASGLPTQVKVLSRVVMPAPPEVSRWLGVPVGAPVLTLERVRYVEGIPLCYVRSYLIEEFSARVLGEDLEVDSVVTILERRDGMQLVETEHAVEALIADVNLAAQLIIAVGVPVLHIQRLFITPKRKAIYYVDSFYRGDRYRYTVKLAQPAKF